MSQIGPPKKAIVDSQPSETIIIGIEPPGIILTLEHLTTGVTSFMLGAEMARLDSAINRIYLWTSVIASRIDAQYAFWSFMSRIYGSMVDC